MEKSMRHITASDRALMILLSLWLVHKELDYTLTDNLFSTRYPMDRGSIGIPLISDVLANIVWSPFYLTIAFLPSARFLRRRLKNPTWWRYPLFAWLGLSYFMAILGAVGFTLKWWKPFHESISLFGFGFLSVLMIFLFVDVRRYFRTRKVRAQLRNISSQQSLSRSLSCPQ
jgi:hypothetical protein